MKNLNKINFFQIDKMLILVTLIICFATLSNLSYWKGDRRVISSDVKAYYGYLPAAFIYDDVTLKQPNEKYNELQHEFELQHHQGQGYFKMTMGMTYLFAPFFLIGHLKAMLEGESLSGFSSPYQYAIAISSLFYLGIGLIFLRKTLKRYFDTISITLTIVAVVFGTNLFYYTIIAMGMSHVYLFSLSAIYFFLIQQWLDKPNYKYAFLIGLVLGVMILIRPTMLIFAAVPFFLEVKTGQDFKNRLQLLLANYPMLILSAILIIAVWIPQMIYWKMMFDTYIFFSYIGESFFWIDPKIIDFLFGFRKGWFVYSPLVLLSLIGFLIAIKKKNVSYVAFLVMLLFYVYINSCWWCWWFGGGFGSRPMIDLYILVAFALCLFFSEFQKFNVVLKSVTGLFMLSCIALNILHNRHCHGGVLHYDGMTKAAYIEASTHLHTQITMEDIAPLIERPNYEEALKGNR